MAVPKAPTTGRAKARTAPKASGAQRLGIPPKAKPLLKAPKSGPSRSHVGANRVGPAPKPAAKKPLRAGGKPGAMPGRVTSASTASKMAQAGADMGKKGKNFSKIAAKAGAKYGSAAAGKRVAGAIFQKMRKAGKL